MGETGSVIPAQKKKNYALLLKQVEGLIEGEHHTISVLANVSALLKSSLEDINWVGFYLLHKGELVLGPFQGKAACMHIPLRKGVCGTAVVKDETQVVEDVHKFPGHIACDSASASEIVIPLRNRGRVVGVLDIDSPSLGRFDAVDADGLEKIARIIEEACDWKHF